MRRVHADCLCLFVHPTDKLLLACRQLADKQERTIRIGFDADAKEQVADRHFVARIKRENRGTFVTAFAHIVVNFFGHRRFCVEILFGETLAGNDHGHDFGDRSREKLVLPAFRGKDFPGRNIQKHRHLCSEIGSFDARTVESRKRHVAVKQRRFFGVVGQDLHIGGEIGRRDRAAGDQNNCADDRKRQNHAGESPDKQEKKPPRRQLFFVLGMRIVHALSLPSVSALIIAEKAIFVKASR